jgi:hypothetical protein
MIRALQCPHSLAAAPSRRVEDDGRSAFGSGSWPPSLREFTSRNSSYRKLIGDVVGAGIRWAGSSSMQITKWSGL